MTPCTAADFRVCLCLGHVRLSVSSYNCACACYIPTPRAHPLSVRIFTPSLGIFLHVQALSSDPRQGGPGSSWGWTWTQGQPFQIMQMLHRGSQMPQTQLAWQT